MARKNDDNFYRRQQDEANRLAATQNRHLNEIAKLAKSSVEEMRKMRRAFEAFSEAMLGMKIEPFQGAVLSEAARGQVAEFDINGFKETLLKGEALTVPGGSLHEAAIERVQETLSLHNPNGRLVKEVLAALDGAPEPEWEWGWMADKERRASMSPRGPRLLIDGHPHTPEEIARFPRGQRVRRRKAGPWEPVEGEKP